MSRPPLSFDELSAYVDGELDAAASARIAALAAQDPEIANAIARLHAVRAAIADDLPDIVQIGPAVPRATRRLTTWLLPAALAASILALVVLGIGQFSAGDGKPAGTSRDVAAMVELHDRWLETSVPSAALRVASNGPVDRLLSVAGLRLVLRDSVAIDDRDAFYSRFVGERGCRLSFFEHEVETVDDQDGMDLSSQGDLLVADWFKGGRRYTMVARSMDPARFATIAGSLRDVLPSDQADEAVRLAGSLAAARQPCLT